MTDFSLLLSADFLKALQRGTDGVWSVDAAVWLLKEHGSWLDDPRLRKYVDGGVDESGELWAGLDIRRINEAIDADEFGEWGEDVAVLCFVLSLYGDFPISLRYTCENLSEESIALIGKALYLACGYSEPRVTGA